MSLSTDTLNSFAPATRAWRFRTWPAFVAVWRARRRTRQQLNCLDDRALADVGLTRVQQRAESAKPFWQP